MRGIALAGSARSCSSTRRASSAPKRRLDRAMVTSAWGGAGTPTSWCCSWMRASGIDAGGRGRSSVGWSELKAGRKVALILNKIDTIARTRLLPLSPPTSTSAMASPRPS
jgi:GTPase